MTYGDNGKSPGGDMQKDVILKMKKTKVEVVLPDAISEDDREQVWEVVAFGSLPTLTVPDDIDLNDDRWPVVKASETVTDAEYEAELANLKAVVDNMKNGTMIF